MTNSTEFQESSSADEAEAARIALGGGFLARTMVGARALRRLLRNPDDTAQVFVVGLTVNARRYPTFLAQFAANEDGARLLRDQPSIDSEHIDYEALRALPEDSLGGAYVRFLDGHDLDPDIFQAPPGIPSMPAYLAKRMRQSHDLWHVVTGYDTDVSSELALQAFTWGVTGMPVSAIIACGGALRFGFTRAHRGLFRAVVDGARRGSRAEFLPVVVWEDHFDRPLAEVRRDLGIAA